MLSRRYDVLVAGAGGAGLMAAVSAAEAGARVLLVEKAERLGGTLHIAGGHMSAAGTRVQAEQGIDDSADLHFEDVMRISRGTADPAMVRLAVDHAADTLHWLLDRGFELTPGHPVIYKGHESYRIARAYWGVEGGASLLNILETALATCVAAGSIAVRRNTELLTITPTSGEVGIKLRGLSGDYDVIAEDVVLTTGGFAGNEALLQRFSGGYHPAPGANVDSQGSGLLAALAAGGTVVNQDKLLAGTGVVADPREPGVEPVSSDRATSAPRPEKPRLWKGPPPFWRAERSPRRRYRPPPDRQGRSGDYRSRPVR